MPPEMFDRTPVPSKKCDVYAYGMILWELVTECVPYKGKYNSLLALTLAVTKDERPDIPDKISTALAHLIMDCWDGSPDRRPVFSEILNEKEDYFNKIICEWVANGQHRVNNLWSQFGKDSSGAMVEEVPWSTFKEAFCQFMNVSEKDPKYSRALKGISTLLETKGENGPVSLQHFERFVQWFSPLQPVGSGQSTFDDVVALLSQNWFWGRMSSEQAYEKLDSQTVPNGSFLVRFSENKEGQFVLSMKIRNNKKDPSVVQHHRIVQKQNLPIITLVNQKIKQFHLKKPLPGRPSEFVSLFTKVEGQSFYAVGPSGEGAIDNTPWHGTNVIY